MTRIYPIGKKIEAVKLLILLGFFFGAIQLYGGEMPQIKSQHQDIYARFTAFEEVPGRYGGRILVIKQDVYGYIWLGGTNGLFRFDGSNVWHYVNDWTPGSIPSSAVHAIAPDGKSRLWVGTENGLCYYDYATDRFVTVLGTDSSVERSEEHYVRQIFPDGDSLLWVDIQKGYLLKIDKNTYRVLGKYGHKYNRQFYYYYGMIFRDRDNTIWFGDRNIGPLYLDEKDGKLKGFKTSDLKFVPGKKRNNDAAWFYSGDERYLWIGSTDGIYLFDKKDSSFNMFYQTSSWAMMSDHQNNLWFSVAKGIARYNPSTGQLITYYPNQEDEASLSGSYVVDIMEDNYHQVWIATGNGVSVLKRGNPGVRYYFHIPGISQTPGSSSITALVQDDQGMVWLGTTFQGIDRFDPVKETFTHYNKDNTEGMPANNIRSLKILPDATLYCGLWAGVGFGKLNPAKRQFTLYSMDKTSTFKDWYSDMALTEAGNLYVGMWGGEGLMLFDTKKEHFIKSLQDKFKMRPNSRLITCLEKDDMGNLWMGTTRTGLHVYFPAEDTSFCYYSKVLPSSPIPDEKILDIEKDADGNIWIVGDSLFRVEPRRAKVEVVKSDHYHSIYSVLPQTGETVWLMTDAGLMKYDHKSKSVTDYSTAVHLSFAENNACGIVLNDGRLMFGGKDGLAIVDPETINLHNVMPSVFLSSLLVFDHVKIPTIEKDNNIRLKHNENFFTIQIGSNVWGETDYYTYYYKLEGFTKDWVQLQPRHREVHFTNVPPGNYHFRVKVEDKQGNVYPDIAGCDIAIIPPIWKQSWFLILVSLFFLSGLFFLIRVRFRTMQMALSNSELNQKLLRLQMNPHFIFNSLFAIQNFIYSKETHLAGNYLSDFARLIRLILDNSTKEYIPFDKELETITLYLKLQKLRFDDKFFYLIETDERLEQGDYQIPPMLAQPFLENAIEHGLKNLERKGKLIVRYELVDNMIRFSVVDNGIGLTASKQQKEKSGSEHKSMAISICKKRLELLRRKKGGNITFMLEEIKNRDGSVAGTKISFNIPL